MAQARLLRFESDSSGPNHFVGCDLVGNGVLTPEPLRLSALGSSPSDFNADARTGLTDRAFRPKISGHKKHANSDALTILSDIYDIH